MHLTTLAAAARRASRLVGVLAAIALLSSAPTARAALVIVAQDSDALAGGTGAFDVYLFNDATTPSVAVGGFSIDIRLANTSAVTFTGISSGTLIPYIYPPALTSGFNGAVLGGGIEVTADDLALTGGVALGAGQSLGLARVTYSVAANAAGSVPVPFISINTGTALSDASGRLIGFSTRTGTIRITPSVVPEPSGLALVAMGVASALAARRLRGRRTAPGC